MNVDIITAPLHLDLFGFSGTAKNKDYTATVFQLSGKMWEVVKSNNIKNKGLNVWVYESDDKVFAGVELENATNNDNHGLERKKIALDKYAYYKHVGAYSLIKQKGNEMINDLIKKGFEIIAPYIEIYGHWASDESELETELIMGLK